MADQTSGDLRGETAAAKMEWKWSIASGSMALRDAQGFADRDQCYADTDQTLSDADQSAADSDLVASDADQAASDMDQRASDRYLQQGGDPQIHGLTRKLREEATDQRRVLLALRARKAAARDSSAPTPRRSAAAI